MGYSDAKLVGASSESSHRSYRLAFGKHPLEPLTRTIPTSLT
jgi:hypothetical protein